VDLVAAAEYKNPREPPGGANLFDKMLKEPDPSSSLCADSTRRSAER
jgi:hypothetical protein